MRLSSIHVKHVRAHDEYSLALDPAITLITGQNGSGKTSLLEAVYLSLRGVSFKGSDIEVLRIDKPWYRIDTPIEGGVVRTVKFDPALESGKKRFEIDNKTYYRLPQSVKYPVILFEPDELRLINGSPSRRRKYIDDFIGQIDPRYALSLRRYDRALKQRNLYLKKLKPGQDLFAWDVSLSKYGAYIVNRRRETLHEITPKLAVIYKAISQSEDEVSIRYSADYNGSIEQELLNDLHQTRVRDTALGYTSVGPHRHDIIFTLNGAPAQNTASRGEVRTIVLALKFLEVDFIRNALEKDPIILLDDVFSELDDIRQQALLERFAGYQTVITSVAFPATNYPVHQLTR